MSYFFGVALFISKLSIPRMQKESSKRRQFLCLQLQHFFRKHFNPRAIALIIFPVLLQVVLCLLLADTFLKLPMRFLLPIIHTGNVFYLFHSYPFQFNQSPKWEKVDAHFIFPVAVSARLMIIFKTQHCLGDTQINEHCFVITVIAMIWHHSAQILLGDHFKGNQALPYGLPSPCSPLFSRMAPIHSIVPTYSLLLAGIWHLDCFTMGSQGRTRVSFPPPALEDSGSTTTAAWPGPSRCLCCREWVWGRCLWWDSVLPWIVCSRPRTSPAFIWKTSSSRLPAPNTSISKTLELKRSPSKSKRINLTSENSLLKYYDAFSIDIKLPPNFTGRCSIVTRLFLHLHYLKVNSRRAYYLRYRTAYICKVNDSSNSEQILQTGLCRCSLRDHININQLFLLFFLLSVSFSSWVPYEYVMTDDSDMSRCTPQQPTILSRRGQSRVP